MKQFPDDPVGKTLMALPIPHAAARMAKRATAPPPVGRPTAPEAPQGALPPESQRVAPPEVARQLEQARPQPTVPRGTPEVEPTPAVPRPAPITETPRLPQQPVVPPKVEPVRTPKVEPPKPVEQPKLTVQETPPITEVAKPTAQIKPEAPILSKEPAKPAEPRVRARQQHEIELEEFKQKQSKLEAQLGILERSARKKGRESTKRAVEAKRLELEALRETEQNRRGRFRLSDQELQAEWAKLRGKTRSVGLDPADFKSMAKIGAHYASALAEASMSGAVTFAKWSKEVSSHLAREGVQLARRELQRIWDSDLVRVARRAFRPTKEPAPHPQGAMARWMRQAGEEGEIAYHEYRRSRDRMYHGVRLLEDRGKKAWKGMKRETREQVQTTLRGVDRKADGTIEFGAVSRAGTRKVPRGQAGQEMQRIEPPGTRLDDGRIVGPILEDGRTQQLYRIIDPKVAERMYENLKEKHPEAKKVLDEILATEEAPIWNFAGDELPTMSRSLLKERYNIEGLTEAEASVATSLARKAYGPNVGGGQGFGFRWVPESAQRGGSPVRRFRSALRPMKARPRFRKSGEAAEKALRGEEFDPKKGFTQAQSDLFVERMHNEAAARLFSVLAEPLSKAERARGRPDTGYVFLSKTGVFGDSVRARRFFERNQEWFEQQGINIPDVINAEFLRGGKGHRIPAKIARYDSSTLCRATILAVYPTPLLIANKPVSRSRSM